MITGGDVLSMLIPTGGWIATGSDFSGVQFVNCAPITKAQFDQGVLDYPAWKAAQDASEASARTTALNKLQALGLTVTDLAALGL